MYCQAAMQREQGLLLKHFICMSKESGMSEKLVNPLYVTTPIFGCDFLTTYYLNLENVVVVEGNSEEKSLKCSPEKWKCKHLQFNHWANFICWGGPCNTTECSRTVKLFCLHPSPWCLFWQLTHMSDVSLPLNAPPRIHYDPVSQMRM